MQDVILHWAGEEYRIAADGEGIVRVIARVEDFITLDELGRFISDQRVPIAKLSLAYGSALRHCGVKVKDSEILAAMRSGDAKGQTAMMDAVIGLLRLMAPPETVAMAEAAAEAEANPTPPAEG